MDEDIKKLRGRYHGALLGLAAGDALGTTLEFTEVARLPQAASRRIGSPLDDVGHRGARKALIGATCPTPSAAGPEWQTNSATIAEGITHEILS
jgi:hypothetical protein